ncbi:hypothetical protein FISHEDRAFT_72197 [Fistulina hepatica ATCC 64428]|uniref:F-box domain-containing protein n=1 Tax=Fistulina hepatica ATCC 64428 TaxID=1128425 RepID=A0A0D7AI19_9AGAR|nr:hypothetical protein FISHEDRAFT_72197 [Fistulina hepatica ATCC 64428]
MHYALLIDELIRKIFDDCFDINGNLASVSRCCKAWSVPALDRQWRVLPSLLPLLRVLPTFECVEGIYVGHKTLHRLPQAINYLYQTIRGQPSTTEISRFHGYATRVRILTHRQNFNIDPSILTSLTVDGCLLPNLTSLHTLASCRQTFLDSPRLRSIDLDLGFRTRRSPIEDTTACYRVARIRPDISRLSIRGTASDSINTLISRLSGVSSLSLKLGSSLLPGTVADVASFSQLRDMELHAAHIGADDISLPFVSFSSLRTLRLTASCSVIHKILSFLPQNTIQTLRLDISDARIKKSTWADMLQLLSQCTADSLTHLGVDWHADLDEYQTFLQDRDFAGSYVTHPTLASLEPAHELRHLRSLSLDMTLPLRFCDKDVERLCQWWPYLEHLDLGSVPTPHCGAGGENREGSDDNGDSQPTGQAVRPSLLSADMLGIIAAGLPFLSSLAAPLDVSLPRELPAIHHHALEQVMNTCYLQVDANVDASTFVQFLHALFPRLMSIRGL